MKIKMTDIYHIDTFNTHIFADGNHNTSLILGWDGHYYWTSLHNDSDDTSLIVRVEPRFDAENNAVLYYNCYHHHYDSKPGTAEECKEFAKAIIGINSSSDHDITI